MEPPPSASRPTVLPQASAGTTTTPSSSSSSLFQVYLRLRPPPSPLVQLTQQSLYPALPRPERWLTVEPPNQPSPSPALDSDIDVHLDDDDAAKPNPTHITLHPPSDSRKRAVEKFAFTRVFEERDEQIEVFRGAGIMDVVDGVVGGGKEGRDGLVATLGVTGSGKVRLLILWFCLREGVTFNLTMA